MLWLGLQALLWLAVFAAASRARSPFGRRRGELLTDETLIDLNEMPPPMASSRIAGEVLGGGVAWQPDLVPELGGGDDETGARPAAPIDTAPAAPIDTAPAAPIDSAADDAELGRSLDELAGPT